MIRKAIESDIPEIVKLCERFHKFAIEPFGLNFNTNDMAAYCKFAISNPLSTLLLLIHNDNIEGMISGSLSIWLGSSKNILLTEQWWWVNPSQRNKVNSFSLIEAFIKWGRQCKATHLIMVSMGVKNEKLMKRFYERKGFKPLETHYIKEI